MSIKKSFQYLFINSRLVYTLSLLFMAFSIHADATPQVKKKKMKTVIDTMIVIEAVPAQKGEPFAEITFRVSQMRYKLSAKANPAYFKLLKESEKKHTPVLIERANITSDVILSVKKLLKK